MNLKFMEDIYITYSSMKTSVYILSWLVGIHTMTFTFYILYKKYNKIIELDKSGTNNDDNDNDTNNDDNDNDTKGVNENTINTLEIQDNKMDLYNNLLSKNTELDQLIIHLNNIQDNITLIREKLEDLNTNTFVVTLSDNNALTPKTFKDKVEKAGFFIA